MAKNNRSRLSSVVALIAIPFISASSIVHSDMVFKYRSSSVSNLSDANQQETAANPAEVDPACDNPANVNTIGNAPGCNGMLIVDDFALRSAASEYADSDGGYEANRTGHGDFEIVHDKTTYTFADSEHNIFTGQVQDMSELFRKTSYNGDVGYWDTSNVTDMKRMFYRNPSFNQDIGAWDISRVTQIYYMFRENSSFDQDVSAWDTSNVTDMSGVFHSASSFNQDISAWDTSSATTVNSMFYGASSFDQDVSEWDVGNVDNYDLFRLGSPLSDSNTPPEFR